MSLTIEKINTRINELFIDEVILNIVENYAKKVNTFLLTDSHVISVEHQFWWRYYGKENIFIGYFLTAGYENQELFDTHDFSIRSRCVASLLAHYSSAYNPIIVNKAIKYLESDFEMLCKVISKRKNLENDTLHKISIFLLIEKVVVKYYADRWRRDYGKYFVNDLLLDDAIKVYLTLDNVDLKNKETVGMFTYFLIGEGKFNTVNFLDCFKYVNKLVECDFEEREVLKYERKLLAPLAETKMSINDIDLMSGVEFEKFMQILLAKMGYSTELTKVSGDQGIDIIARKNEQKIGVQAKCYSGKVSNSAVQEVVAGLAYYKLDKGIVVTNSWYTDGAIQLAQANNIVLWDRDMLSRKINEVII